jgi:hypothetical protein
VIRALIGNRPSHGTFICPVLLDVDAVADCEGDVLQTLECITVQYTSSGYGVESTEGTEAMTASGTTVAKPLPEHRYLGAGDGVVRSAAERLAVSRAVVLAPRRASQRPATRRGAYRRTEIALLH